MVQSQPQQVLSQLHALLDTVSLDAYGELDGSAQAEAATSLMRLEARVRAHQLAATRAVHASGEARKQGATSTGSLLAGSFGGDRRSADGAVKQAEKLAAASQTNQALARGELSVGQADLIVKTLETLPGEVTESQREACETQLLCDAPSMDLKQLARRADRIADVFAPDQVDAIENDIVEAREKKA